MNLIGFILSISLSASPALAQTLTLRGQATDESGGVVPGATVLLTGPGGLSKTTRTANDGSYTISHLPSGNYTIQAAAPGLALRQPAKVSLRSGNQILNLVLNVVLNKQEVTVEEGGKPAVTTDAAGNASAVVLKGEDLDALSDNPDDLMADLQALAGPAAGPNGGSIFIDGFSGGQLPPKNAIREIRINQNPFSPEYDRLGFGRIEIFTKPGSDKFHADFGYNFANDKWNSRNPYAAQKAPFRLNEIRGGFNGPLNKHASFNVILIREWVDNGNAVNGVILDSQTLAITPFTDTPVSMLRRTGITPRVDYRLSTNHTLSVRYAYHRDDVHNAGMGGLNLVSRGFRNDAPSHTVQLTETAVLGASAVNETRFQYFRPETISQASAAGFALQVLGAFNGGGNPVGHSVTTQNNYEFQNYTLLGRRAHTLRFGIRARATSETSEAPQNFAGAFTFSGGLAPLLDANNQPIAGSLANISSIESYRRTLLFQQMGVSAPAIRQRGGGATQFSISSGNLLISGDQVDVGVFIGDEWKTRPNLTVSMGLRYETQTNIHDWRDMAPRIGVAWAPGGSAKSRPKSVIRAGFGLFYDRFSLSNVLTAARYNGIVQQQYVITNPDFFPSVPPIAALPGPAPPSTIQKISSDLRAPYLMQSILGFERQIPFNTTVAITYANTHGLHMLRSQDINAPLAGTYDPAVRGSGVFPLARPGLVALMESSGLYNQNQIIVNVNSRVNRNVSLNGTYAHNRAKSNTDSLITFPADPHSMAGEYGPAATDIHHHMSMGGTITAKWGIRFNPLLTANSGPPFDITTGSDLFGDTLFNARPAIATDPNKPGVVRTKYGLLDLNPVPGERLIPRNFGRGPGQIMLNIRVGRTFSFGSRSEAREVPMGGGGPGGGPGGGGRGGPPSSPFSTAGGNPAGSASSSRRYNLTISMQIRNLANHNNPGPIIGNITSPLFGQANQPAGSGGGIFSESANNRRLELQTRFTF